MFRWLFVASTLAFSANAVSLPGCQATAPIQKTLNNVRTAFVSVPNHPFGIAYAKQNDVAFVALSQLQTNITSTLGVLNTSTFPPTLRRNINLPPVYVDPYPVEGLGVTHDGKDVLVCSGPGLIAVDAMSAIAGSPHAVVGTLNGTTTTQHPGFAAIEVTISPDDQYAFVSQEYGNNNTSPGNIDVFKLQRSTQNKSVSGTPLGFLRLGHAVVGTALSPDGRTLYATSETTSANDTTPGTLSVVDVATLQTHPAQALLSTAAAGCGPVRALVSADGQVVWVTARDSNHLLAYNASQLVSDPNAALLASVQVGTAPVGLVFVRNGTRILTADSNRYSLPNATSGISVVDVHAVLHGNASQAVLGRVPAGLFPREMTVSRDGGTVLVSNYLSLEIQAIDVATLP